MDNNVTGEELSLSPTPVLVAPGVHIELGCFNQPLHLLPQFLPNKIGGFACPAGNASCALNYSPGKALVPALEQQLLPLSPPKAA